MTYLPMLIDIKFYNNKQQCDDFWLLKNVRNHINKCLDKKKGRSMFVGLWYKARFVEKSLT